MPAGIYLHIPFCKSRCSYCDFATDVYRDSAAVERYVDALVREIECFSVSENSSVSVVSPVSGVSGPRETVRADTIYFGGGTPSLLAPKQVERILDAVFSMFQVENGAEITMEMNPATVSPETLRDFRSIGVNRASFGVQTFNDRDLKLLARGHDANDARTTFQMLRDAGFDNISFDLIAGLPGQTMADWKTNLNEAVKLSPEHISLYLLEIHEATPLAEQVRAGRRTPIDEELAAEMYEHMLDRLAASGYEQYEISNFSKIGFQSRHNTKYWRLDPVYGFGVSAHSFDGEQRYANERGTIKYVEMMNQAASAEVTREIANLQSEHVFLGLRMERGISLQDFAERFGFDLMEKYQNEASEIFDLELIEISEGVLRLTDKGKLFSNEVFSVFV